MDQFLNWCDDAASFPLRVVQTDLPEHRLLSYAEKLDEKEEKLFIDGKSRSPNVISWELGKDEEFCRKNAQSLHELQKHFGYSPIMAKPDPRCRYLFVGAPHSRERLSITREMFLFIMTYLQAMPSFLDLLFAFGLSEHAQDFHFSQLQYEHCLTPSDCAYEIPEMERSRQQLHLCYNLRSVEKSPGQPGWPWSIRNCAVYHSFDLESGAATWIVLKANSKIRARIMAETKSRLASRSNTYVTRTEALAASLQTHIWICEWAVEEWRWHISDIESALQRKTGHALSSDALSIVRDEPNVPTDMKAANNGGPSFNRKKQRSFIFRTRELSKPPSYHSYDPSHNVVIDEKWNAGNVEIPTMISTEEPLALDQDDTEEMSRHQQAEFSFDDLQQLQKIQERTRECHLVVTTNRNIFKQLRDQYKELTDSEYCPADYQAADESIERFNRRISSLEDELLLMETRLGTLLQLIKERKQLLYSILEYRSLLANQDIASRAQKSAGTMERINTDMHEIAQRTQRETISMKIITLVTLFFLPGTFISTLMSTDIISFPIGENGRPEGLLSTPALELFLMVSIPLMTLTFVAWYLTYWWGRRREKMTRTQSKAEQKV